MTATARLVVMLLAAMAQAAPALAHDRVRALVSFDPPKPLSGEPCAVTVRFENTAGVPQALRDRQVRLVADMTGHAMRPVEATLAPADKPGTFRGELAFTMAGPWRVEVTAVGGHDTIKGTTSVEVLLEPDPPTPAGTPAAAAAAPTAPTAVDMDLPETGSSSSPWWILLSAVALTVLLEGAAVARRVRTTRAARRTSDGDRRAGGHERAEA